MELRFIERAIPMCENEGRIVKILQYRNMLNPLEAGLQEPIWSEWTDVPLVTLEEVNGK